jgi:hypothetical protein
METSTRFVERQATSRCFDQRGGLSFRSFFVPGLRAGEHPIVRPMMALVVSDNACDLGAYHRRLMPAELSRRPARILPLLEEEDLP